MARSPSWLLYASHPDPDDPTTWSQPTKRALCPVCMQVFSTDNNAETHRVLLLPDEDPDPPTRRCMNEAEMKKAGLTKDSKGVWHQAGEGVGSPTWLNLLTPSKRQQSPSKGR